MIRTGRGLGRFRPLVLVATLACSDSPVAWQQPEYTQAIATAAATAGDDRLCALSETEHTGLRFRAGWERSTGHLVVLRSPDGGASWGPPVVADSRRQEAAACDRPAPALFADSANGFLHVAYFADVAGEPGVYYVHSMDAERLAQTGVGMFEQPVPLTFGARPSRTGVASRGDTVTVAYEDPNSARGALQLALSFTAGHSFGWRLPVFGSAAAEPAVLLRGGSVTVQWREAGGTGRLVRRTGLFQ